MAIEKVPREEALGGYTNRKDPSEISLMLAHGDTLFCPGWKHDRIGTLRQPAGYLAKNGFKVHARKGKRLGVDGLYVWAEKEA